MKKKLILIHKSMKSEPFRRFIRPQDNVFWMYMGRDYSNMLIWREHLSGIAQQVEFSKELQLKANELRRPFLDFIAEIGHQNNKFAYWSSIFFEKNTVLSPLFLYCCYLEVLKHYLNHNSKFMSIIIISDSWPFLETIKTNFSSPLVEIAFLKNNVSKTFCTLKGYSEIIKNSIFFAAKSLLEYTASKIYHKNDFLYTNENFKRKKSKLIILRTWVHSNFFDKEGIFNDVYLPSLANWIKTKGYDIKIMPLILMSKPNIRSILKSYKNMILLLRKEENNFIVPWDYLKVRDIFNTFKMSFGQLWLKFDKHNFHNWNLHILLNEERRRFALNQRGLGCILHYLLFQRLAEKNVEIERVIYTFENMLTEKLFLIGLKKFYPNTKSIGFQHSVLFPLKLDMYVSEKEIADLPLPTKIVCSGEIFRNIMIKEYYPAEKLKIGPALRFAHMFNKKEYIKKLQSNCVIVACPGYKNELIELLFKVFTALKDEDVSLWIKPKPGTPMIDIIDEIIKLTGIHYSKIKIVSGPLSELISQTNVMITIASGAIIDGITSGIPVLRIKREMDLDLDPIDWFEFDPKRDFIAYTISDIRKEVIRALNLSEQDKEWLINYGQEFAKENFSPIAEGTLNVFLS